MNLAFSTSKQALEAALQVVMLAVASGNDDAKLETHILFRVTGQKKVELLSSNGQRLFARAVLDATLTSGDIGDRFTAPGWRLRSWASVLDDDDELSMTSDGASTKAKSKARGKGQFASLDPKDFPYWDEQFDEAKITAKLQAAHLTNLLSFSRKWVTEEENKHGPLAASEVRNGILSSSDSKGACLIESDALKGSNFRVHGKDASAVLSFLALKGADAEVSLKEHERCLMLMRGDALFGVTRWMYDFPDLKLNPNEPGLGFITLDTAELQRAKKYLGVFAAVDTKDLIIRFGDGKVFLSTPSVNTDVEEQAVTCVEHENVSKLTDAGVTQCIVAEKYLDRILDGLPGPKVKLGFGLVKNKKHGYFTFHDERDGDKNASTKHDRYFTLIVWKK